MAFYAATVVWLFFGMRMSRQSAQVASAPTGPRVPA